MSQALSERAQRFIQTWERQPYVQDLGLVCAAIQEAWLPVTDPVLDFHRTFAGYVTDVWGEVGPLGIIHREVSPQSWFQPMKVGGYLTGKVPYLACADIHVSYEMMIQLDGTFYCNGPEASSYFMWTEQCAFLWEFEQTRRGRRIGLTANPFDMAAVLLRRLEGRRIDALSDAYGEVYATEQLVVMVGRQGQRCHVLVEEGEQPAELRGLASGR